MSPSVFASQSKRHTLVAVFCLVLAIIPVDAVIYYGAAVGPYGTTVAGAAVVRPGRRGFRYYGRKLLGQEEKQAKCETMLDVIESRPMLSDLALAIRDLPRIREALNNSTATDTFFAPSNAAIKSLVEWGGYDSIKEGLKEFFSTKEIKGLIIAYHAIPNQKLLYGQLNAMNGQFLQTALSRVLDSPGSLEVSSYEGNIYIKGYGSEAKIVAADIPACGSVVHVIDGVLLPVDGDGELSDEQKNRIERARKALDKGGEDDDEYAPAPSPDDAEAPAPAPSDDKLLEEIEDEIEDIKTDGGVEIDDNMYSDDDSYASAPAPAPAPLAYP